MRNLLSILFLSIGLAACNDKPSNANINSKSLSDAPVWASPVFPRFETYINHHALSPTQGNTTTHNLGFWTENSKIGDLSCKGKCGYVGQTLYSFNLVYQGTQGGGDHYQATISYPLDSAVHTVEKSVIYRGEELDIFKDNEWRIGLRPYTNN